MYGDVFGNRDPDSCLPGLDTNELLETPTFRWQPALDLSRRVPKYGYDPWTKAAYRFDASIKWWCYQPHNPVWHAAIQYALGSILFVVASAAALFTYVRQTTVLKQWLFDYPYLLGSVNYTIGASILLYESWINHPSNLSDPYFQATPRQVGGVSPAGVAGSAATTIDGFHPSVDTLYGSMYEGPSAAENVSRPPSFASTHRWWLAGPEIGLDGDPEASASSLPQGAATHGSNGVDVDVTQPLLENEVVPGAGHRYGVSASDDAESDGDIGQLTTTATLSMPIDSAALPPQEKLHIRTARRSTAAVDHASSCQKSSRITVHLGVPGAGDDDAGGEGDDDSEIAVSLVDAPDESMTCDETGTARSYEGSYASETFSYHHIFGRRWRATSTAENITSALLDVPHRHPGQLNTIIHNYYTRDAYFHVHADPWYTNRWRLDLGGSFAIWVGALLYNIACVSSAFKVTFGYLPPVHPDPAACEALLLYWPDTIGGVLFVIGSWLYWWSAHGTPGPFAPKPGTIEWVVTVLNLLGSFGFFYGAVTSVAYVEVPMLVGNWVELTVGYVIGSALFMVGSYLMVVELASHSGG